MKKWKRSKFAIFPKIFSLWRIYRWNVANWSKWPNYCRKWPNSWAKKHLLPGVRVQFWPQIRIASILSASDSGGTLGKKSQESCFFGAPTALTNTQKSAFWGGGCWFASTFEFETKLCSGLFPWFGEEGPPWWGWKRQIIRSFSTIIRSFRPVG